MDKRILSEEEESQKINSSFIELENQRAIGIERTQKTQQTKQTAMTREKERLTAKYGANHERVAKIDRQLKTNPHLFRSFDEVAARTSIKTPDTTPDDWMVYGSVKDTSQRRVQGLTISLFDTRRQWVRELGYVCTDEKGQFSLKVPDVNGKLSEKYKDKPLYLTVTNDHKDVLHKEDEPLFFAKGKIENREIIFSVDPCGTPPEDENNQGSGDYVIEGIISNQQGSPLSGLRIKAVDHDDTGENPLGTEVSTDEKGSYKIHYKATDFIIKGKETRGANIILYVHDKKGKPVYTSESYRNSPKIYRIDLTIDTSGRKK